MGCAAMYGSTYVIAPPFCFLKHLLCIAKSPTFLHILSLLTLHTHTRHANPCLPRSGVNLQSSKPEVFFTVGKPPKHLRLILNLDGFVIEFGFIHMTHDISKNQYVIQHPKPTWTRTSLKTSDDIIGAEEASA